MNSLKYSPLFSAHWSMVVICNINQLAQNKNEIVCDLESSGDNGGNDIDTTDDSDKVVIYFFGIIKLSDYWVMYAVF